MNWGNCDYKQLQRLRDSLATLQSMDMDRFCTEVSKELAARLLALVIPRTPVGQYPKSSGKKGGTMRRGWTSKTQADAASRGGSNDAKAYAEALPVRKSGNAYTIEVINPVEYASYVEFGHRTRGGDGWVPGQTLFGIEEAAERATIIQYLLSDAGQIAVWPSIKKHLTPGKALYFSHGFGITYKERTGIVPPADVDVILIAPKGSGTSLRRMFLQGRGLNSSYAVFQDATGRAFERVVALGIGVGSGYLFETDFKREVYSDLTGERGTLMGAIQGIFAAQYDTLRANGHTPSEAFNETVEELTQSLMPLVAENGMDWMYANCSTTAQRGALDWWKKFRDATKPVFEELYREVAAGNEAQRSIDLNSKPDYREKLNEELREMRESEMWQTGAVVRKLRPENN